MILKLKQWCEGIVIAIILSTIIEMLIPDNKSKKYIKVVIGIYILFVSLNPILELLHYDLEFENIFIFDNNVEVASNFDNSVKDIYILGIEKQVKEDIENLGYILEKVQVVVDSNYEEITEISLKIKNKENANIIEIEKVNIEKNKNEKNNYEDIVNLLMREYFVDKEKIFIEV